MGQASRKKDFTAVALDPRYETFIVQVASLENLSNTQEGNIYLFCRVQIAALVANEALTSIFSKYSNFADIFSLKLALEFSEHTRIHNHAIKLMNDQ